ncbi:MAG TPA: hypothetical protein VHA52_09060 [Candidatus Babeliaceae bacterium]|nr:hypothetical protein [Candidatus Babeliaceae bacterium]
MESGIVTWGLKSFYARTPQWAKHIILIIFGAFASVLIFDQANPGIIPANAEHYIIIATPVLMLCFKAFGIKYSTNNTTTES